MGVCNKYVNMRTKLYTTSSYLTSSRLYQVLYFFNVVKIAILFPTAVLVISYSVTYFKLQHIYNRSKKSYSQGLIEKYGPIDNSYYLSPKSCLILYSLSASFLYWLIMWLTESSQSPIAQ